MKQTNLHSSRIYFIFGRILNLMCRYIALSILLDPALFLRLPGPDAPYPVAEDFEPSRRPFFRRLLPGNAGGSDLKRAAVLRFHWFFTSSLLDYLMFTIGYDVLVIFAVALRLDEPVQWKLYGNPAEAFTVRRYWARWHHLIVYRPLVTLAAKMVGRGGSYRRYIHNCIVFIISGLMHSAVTFIMDPQKSLRCGFLGATWYYTLQPLGMVVEAAVFQLWFLVERRLLLRLGDNSKRVYHGTTRSLGRCLGEARVCTIGRVLYLVWKMDVDTAQPVLVSTLNALGWHVEILCDIDDSALSQSIFLHPVLLVIVFLGTLDKSGIQLTMTLSQLPS
ncbi:Acetyltransferase ataH [Colletotrichum spinosum]|uniref:Acetyltransferase ataH n=1 Tax=Colletotrichum spinosum TaxID=1347390 RepID=A0A4R8Q7E7_9PEZI|nr:Acetyltransferase ataH [Colletotrichum spinosum]